MRPNSDSQLVIRAQQGDDQAFAALFDKHRRRVYSLCLRMTCNPGLSEDLTQDAFLQVLRKISTFRAESAFSTWLHRVVTNVVLVYLRRRRLQEVPLEDSESHPEDFRRCQFGRDDSSLQVILDRISLLRALEALPHGYRTAIHLYDLEGYQHLEIAELTEWTVGTSKSQLHKARRRLRQLLSEKKGGAGFRANCPRKPTQEVPRTSPRRDRGGPD